MYNSSTYNSAMFNDTPSGITQQTAVAHLTAQPKLLSVLRYTLKDTKRVTTTYRNRKVIVCKMSDSSKLFSTSHYSEAIKGNVHNIVSITSKGKTSTVWKVTYKSKGYLQGGK